MMGIGRIDGSSESTPGPRHGAKIVPGAHVPVRLATDKAVISREAKHAVVLTDARVERARSEPAVRADRVAEARARLETGALDQPEVLRAAAEKIVDSLD
ncbi:MAG: hypothetical protein H6837_19230 [Planctomycetes bacterium]|nr:hypothetical protein [Planctomycetota bacterium]